MAVSDGSAVSAAVTNSAFLSRTADSDTVAKISLNKPTGSGDLIDDAQLTLNQAKTFVSTGTLTITAAGTIGINAESATQHIRVVGDSGAVTTSLTPFGTGAFADGALLRIVGTDDTNTVTIGNNDAADGIILNGDATLKKYYILTVAYDLTLDRFIEVTRNW